MTGTESVLDGTLEGVPQQADSPPSSVSTAHAWRPRPWVAAVLNIFGWGLGALYAGRPRRAVGIYLLVQLAAAALIALTFVVSWPFARIILLVTALPGAIIFTAVDGWRTARRAPQAERRPYQRWYVLLGVWLVASMLAQPRLLDAVRDHVQAFRIPSGSMTPTVLEGEYLFAVMHVPDPLERSTVVVHHDDRGAGFLRRVVGLPGDTLEMRYHRLFVNGVAAEEPYASVSDSTDYESPEHFAWQTRTTSPRRRPNEWCPRARRGGRSSCHRANCSSSGTHAMPVSIAAISASSLSSGSSGGRHGSTCRATWIAAPSGGTVSDGMSGRPWDYSRFR